MKPSKTAYATKKKPAKRKERNPIVSKLRDLKYRINKAYDAGRDTDEDKLWVMGQISALREGARLDRHQMKYANQLWRTYST